MVNDRWDELEPLIRLPLEKTGAIDLYSTADILGLVKKGEMQCWAVIDDKEWVAAIVTQVIKYPRQKVFDVYLVGGSRMNEWLDMVWDDLKRYGRESGCRAIRGFGRKGWTKRIKEPIEYSVTWSVGL